MTKLLQLNQQFKLPFNYAPTMAPKRRVSHCGCDHQKSQVEEHAQ